MKNELIKPIFLKKSKGLSKQLEELNYLIRQLNSKGAKILEDDIRNIK